MALGHMVHRQTLPPEMGEPLPVSADRTERDGPMLRFNLRQRHILTGVKT